METGIMAIGSWWIHYKVGSDQISRDSGFHVASWGVKKGSQGLVGRLAETRGHNCSATLERKVLKAQGD